ncbi:Thioredoxin-like [Abditibacterium utsteinense]|uniref:Thioredoxin-like n=1 Tax=Abditibacterium utsteinense TaxID=1960156 RepID=A0A2S8SQ08_9BACT|nr:thioredoxin family protein [Abditibacterium utsteinense]PQV62849.1 Thioredoxin-like [Abditibacterium utsteinense]
MQTNPTPSRKDAARPWLFGAIFVWTLTGAIAWAAYSSRAVPASPAVLVPDLAALQTAPAKNSAPTSNAAQSDISQANLATKNEGKTSSKANGIVWEADFESAMQRARAENLPIMIDFYTDWCGWCKELDRQVFPSKIVVQEAKKWVSLRINAEKRPDVAGAYGVTGYPTIVFAEKSGKPLSVLPGFAPAPDFVAAMQEARAKIK